MILWYHPSFPSPLHIWFWVFFRLSLVALLGSLFASRLLPPSCPAYPWYQGTSSQITVLLTRSSHFSGQDLTKIKVLILCLMYKVPRNTLLICLPGIIWGRWKKRPADHSLFYSWASCHPGILCPSIKIASTLILIVLVRGLEGIHMWHTQQGSGT